MLLIDWLKDQNPFEAWRVGELITAEKMKEEGKTYGAAEIDPARLHVQHAIVRSGVDFIVGIGLHWGEGNAWTYAAYRWWKGRLIFDEHNVSQPELRGA